LAIVSSFPGLFRHLHFLAQHICRLDHNRRALFGFSEIDINKMNIKLS
jgi:hypothetical protein